MDYTHTASTKTDAQTSNKSGDIDVSSPSESLLILPKISTPNKIDPRSLTPNNILALQRTVGNRAVQRIIKDYTANRQAIQRVAGVTKQEEDTAKKSSYDDFDGKQFRVSGQPPDRKVQEVRRRVLSAEEKLQRGGQEFEYVATGEVIGFTGNKPIIRDYPQPVSLGDWYPQVTHVNGMNVNPEEGIEGVEALQGAVNKALQDANKGNGVALGQEAIDVLYTYSAMRGSSNSVKSATYDLWDCIKGKLGVNDTVTKSQEQIILDAVHTKKRTTVSAHSRGTIKTDNAVRAAFDKLTEEQLQLLLQNKDEVNRAINLASQMAEAAAMSGSVSIMSEQDILKQKAQKNATQEMDEYIQLIYAGNAVSYPSSVLPPELFVGKADFVSMFVGSYTATGAKLASWNSQTTMNKQSGGHGFVENYAQPVGKAIANDIATKRQPQE